MFDVYRDADLQELVQQLIQYVEGTGSEPIHGTFLAAELYRWWPRQFRISLECALDQDFGDRVHSYELGQPEATDTVIYLSLKYTGIIIDDETCLEYSKVYGPGYSDKKGYYTSYYYEHMEELVGKFGSTVNQMRFCVEQCKMYGNMFPAIRRARFRLTM